MNDKIRVKSSRSGCWMVLRGEYLLDIYPPHMKPSGTTYTSLESRPHEQQ